MNIVVVLAVAAVALGVLWLVQSVVLKLAGEPLAWPLRYSTQQPLVRWTGRILVHSTWLAILVGTPLALGIAPLDALRQAFPTPVPWRDIGIAFALMCVPALLVYAFYLAAGWARVEPQHERSVRLGKLVRRFLGPVPLATMEEAVFRGVVLEQLLRSLPASRAFIVLAIALSAVVFSAVHFVKKPYPGKPMWQPALGLFVVGCLLGTAYVVGGRSLWLPIAMHAAAVFVVETMRLYVVFQRPAWLMGYTEFPHSGLVGLLLLFVVGLALVALI